MASSIDQSCSERHHSVARRIDTLVVAVRAHLLELWRRGQGRRYRSEDESAATLWMPPGSEEVWGSELESMEVGKG